MPWSLSATLGFMKFYKRYLLDNCWRFVPFPRGISSELNRIV